mmetsp:Transcript_4527/g.7311  ORF Transcript_4527/g.7311 Transcript_4527/m.7311 type:complete len:359 (+) Transcript_4527:103-1179(+)
MWIVHLLSSSAPQLFSPSAPQPLNPSDLDRSALTALKFGQPGTHEDSRGLQTDSSESLGGVWPRVLVVSRRHLRKGKYVDFVGEYHIDLIQDFGGCPIIVPRTVRTVEQLDAYTFGGVDGVLVMEGQDISDRYNPYGTEVNLQTEELEKVKSKHSSDVEKDDVKDSLEMALIKQKVLEEGVPYLGLCRGSQMLNVAMGGTLYFDVVAETGTTVKHIDYDNYDGHRHPISVLPNTPLSEWFHEEFSGRENESIELSVNSYHHQGIKKLAPGLEPLCHSLDGLLEGYYDPKFFDPENGRFRVGLQWHPERMMDDYVGCARVYQDFIRAASRHKELRMQRARGRLVSGMGSRAETQQQMVR